MFRKLFLVVLVGVAIGIVWVATHQPVSVQVVQELSNSEDSNKNDAETDEVDGSPPVNALPVVVATATAAEEELDWGVNWKDARRSGGALKSNPDSKGVIVGARAGQSGARSPLTGTENSSNLAIDDARSFFSDVVEPERVPANSASGDPDTISGYRGASVGEGAVAATPTAVKTAVRKDEGLLPWARGQARGYAMLYAMHPAARPLVEQQVKALLDARIRQPYIGVLIDGTFSQDFEYLKSIVTRLSVDGRAMTLALYLTNGPTMRKWDTTPIDVLFNKIEPGLFRGLIVEDRGIRDQFSRIVSKAKEVFDAHILQDDRSRNVAIVMLEDNLDRRSYAAMRSMTAEQLGTEVMYIRNPCEGCYADGLSDSDTQGDGREEHSQERFRLLREGDGFTLDGIGFEYPNTPEDNEGSSAVSSDGMQLMMNEAYRRKLSYVGLWRHGWQGVKQGVANKHPDQRTYQLSTPAEIDFEIKALRYGLELESN